MLRACTRESPRPDVTPEQTHDDYEWLNEEDGQKDVTRDRRDRDRCCRSPPIGQNKAWGASWKNDSGAQNRRGNRRDRGRVRRVRLIALGGGAARVRLSRSDYALRTGFVGTAPVHRAVVISTARHSCLGCCPPAGTDGGVPGDQPKAQDDGGYAVAQAHDLKHA